MIIAPHGQGGNAPPAPPGVAVAGSADAPALPPASGAAPADAGPEPALDELAGASARIKAGGAHDDSLMEAVVVVRKLLSIAHKPPIAEVIETGIAPYLVALLGSADEKLAFEAAWALTNIASGESAHTRVVVECGAVVPFGALLESPNHTMAEQAAWALGNIAGDSTELRDLVLGHGVLPKLSAQLTADRPVTLLRNGVWALSNLCRGKPQPAFSLVREALPALARLIFSADDEVLTDACWALSYLSDGADERIQAVLDCGAGARVVELMAHSSPSVQTPALRTVGNIVTGNDMQTQVMLNAGCLPQLGNLLRHSKQAIRKEACWSISNITAGSVAQITAVIESGCIAPLINMVSTDQAAVRKEALWALSNATSGGSEEQIMYLVEAGMIPAITPMLSVDDPKLIMVALEGIENMLRVGAAFASRTGAEDNPVTDLLDEAGAIDAMEALQEHESESVYSLVLRILTTYFSTEDEDGDEQGAQPEVQDIQSGVASFSFN